MDDECSHDMLSNMDTFNEIIYRGLQKGHMLVHCLAGVSRSVTAIASYLIGTLGFTAPQAVCIIREGRPRAGPNDGFCNQLIVFEKRIQREKGGRLVTEDPLAKRQIEQTLQGGEKYSNFNLARRIILEKQGEGSIKFGIPNLEFALHCKQCGKFLVEWDDLMDHDPSSSLRGRKQHLEPEDLVSERTIGKDYILHEKLGAGGFGTVFRATHSRTGDEVVAKKIRARTDVPDHEAEFMTELDHPRIIRLLDHFTDTIFTFLILDLIPNCIDMFDYIGYKNRIPEQNAKYILAQLTSALCYLHEEKQIAHLDVKPENILIQPDTGNIKLIDFGAAQRITSSTLTTFRGTRQYASPEILFTGEYDPVAADIWALGVTFYKMVMGHLPFKRSRDYLKPLSFTLTGVSTLCLKTISIILNPNPDLRPGSVRDVKNSLWMTT
ncbi:hypothetical protein ACHWQZ_G012550 [Mnemiopsis leidyi]